MNFFLFMKKTSVLLETFAMIRLSIFFFFFLRTQGNNIILTYYIYFKELILQPALKISEIDGLHIRVQVTFLATVFRLLDFMWFKVWKLLNWG